MNARTRPSATGLSARALLTPEPFVRMFARRVQQEGALDLTQGDYKNADFAPHPEVVRAAQRITRNTVHSYGPAVGRLDVRNEVAEFFNRDGLIDYPGSEVRFLPDEVLFTPGTRAGLAIVLEVLGADGSGVVVPRPSWEYDWFIERAGKKVVELPTSAPEFLPDPVALDRLLAQGNVSSVILNNPHNPTGRVYPRELVEELVRVAVKHRCYVLYDSVYQRLDYVGWFVNPAFANPEWRDYVISLSGLSKMDMFGASTGAALPPFIAANAVGTSLAAPYGKPEWAPTAANTFQPRCDRNSQACSGFSAARIAGSRTMCITPLTASAVNHSTMTGRSRPLNRRIDSNSPPGCPSLALPARWLGLRFPLGHEEGPACAGPLLVVPRGIEPLFPP